MKRLLVAALAALPMFLVAPHQAHAEGGCLNLQGCFRVKICGTGCLKAWCEPFCCAPCNSCACPGGGCGGGGYPGGGCPGGGCNGCPGFDECHGIVPGPWYTYWPYGGMPFQSSSEAYPAWVYDMHFQTPAPVPYPFWPAASPTAFAAGEAPPVAASVQSVGYTPQYWYGR
jgi:hypothetical protein